MYNFESFALNRIRTSKPKIVDNSSDAAMSEHKVFYDAIRNLIVSVIDGSNDVIVNKLGGRKVGDHADTNPVLGSVRFYENGSRWYNGDIIFKNFSKPDQMEAYYFNGDFCKMSRISLTQANSLCANSTSNRTEALSFDRELTLIESTEMMLDSVKIFMKKLERRSNNEQQGIARQSAP